MRPLRFLPAALALIAATPAAARLAPVDLEAIAALEQRVVAMPGAPRGTQPAPIEAVMAQARVPGVSIAFLEDGKVKWARAYGETMAGSGRKVTTRTRFQAASMSKPVVAAAALRLTDQGRLSLDGSANAELSGWRIPSLPGTQSGDSVSLRQLLSHTAGLSVSAYPGYAAATARPTLLESLDGRAPSATAAVRAYASPGAQFGYSGGGYSVVQLMMTGATGNFESAMARLVFGPAKMRGATFATEPSRNIADGHDASGVPLPGGYHRYPELAAAGMWTSASDYGRFLIAIQRSWIGEEGALLQPKTARAMTTPVSNNYGLGIEVVARENRRAILHGGSNEGYEGAAVAFLDGSRQGLVILTNGQYGGRLAAALQRTIGRVYGWVETAGPRPPRAPEV